MDIKKVLQVRMWEPKATSLARSYHIQTAAGGGPGLYVTASPGAGRPIPQVHMTTTCDVTRQDSKRQNIQVRMITLNVKEEKKRRGKMVSGKTEGAVTYT